jgi:hypothetical protein
MKIWRSLLNALALISRQVEVVTLNLEIGDWAFGDFAKSPNPPLVVIDSLFWTSKQHHLMNHQMFILWYSSVIHFALRTAK